MSFSKVFSGYEPRSKHKDAIIGNPILYDKVIEDDEVSLREESINRHGLICGKSGEGKTNTVVKIAIEMNKNNITTHILDVKGDIETDFSGVFPSEKLNILDVSALGDDFSFQKKEIIGKNNVYRARFTGANRTLIEKKLMLLLQAAYELKNSKTIEHVIFLEEAPIFLESQTLTDKLFEMARIIRSRGVGIYFVSQGLKLFPRRGLPDNEEEVLYDTLQNLIFHSLEGDEDINIACNLMRLTQFPPDQLLYSLENELKGVGKGKVIVSFVDDNGKRMAPIRVSVPNLLEHH